ncbi:hypothetical protein J4526_04990 [Desulfurococcaceae archaeon MEX13E-LK6-19]|nr:hypothetical protein J4526_04990 [Desulfurococcaceae archaeon MEX13E-LK6-19]
MSEEKPLLADGSIIEDYRPLLVYWRKARKVKKELADKAILSNEDFRELQQVVESLAGKSLFELIELFKKKFSTRIDPDLAREAIKEVYGVELSSEEARDRIAYIMAGWLLEAGRQMKIIGYRSWRNGVR